MSLLEKLKQGPQANASRFIENFGVSVNPFPTSNQTSNNPHYSIPEDDAAEKRIMTFLRDRRSEVLVIRGTQGVGKTNFLNYLEDQIQEAKTQLDGYYVVKYMADPESTFDGTIRTIFQELGVDHLKKIANTLIYSQDALSKVRSYDLRQALLTLSNDIDNDEIFDLCLEWLFGLRLLNAHKYGLGVTFRLDTVESRTAVLRDYIQLSTEIGELKGIFLLLDELEKQAGVLGPRAVVRYLSALRAIIDALPKFLFLVIAITPDAMLRYSSALPAFRSRLDNQIHLSTLNSIEEAQKLAEFYLHQAQTTTANTNWRTTSLITEEEISKAFAEAAIQSKRRGDDGVRQREFLNKLHDIVENKFQALV